MIVTPSIARAVIGTRGGTHAETHRSGRDRGMCVGDSRLYLIRDEVLQLLTADHSLVQAQVQSGVLTAHDATRAPHKHVLTRAVGVHPLVDVELGELPVLNGDILLLCSDGLTAGVPGDQILRVVQESFDPQMIADRLIALSNAAGGTDNTTVIAAMLSHRKPGLWHRMCAQLFAAPTTESS